MVSVSQSVILSTGVGVPCEHYTWCIASHHTLISLQPWAPPIPVGHGTSLLRENLPPDMGPHCTGLPFPTSVDIWRLRLESHSNLFTWGILYQCWHLVATERRTVGKGRYASSWNLVGDASGQTDKRHNIMVAGWAKGMRTGNWDLSWPTWLTIPIWTFVHFKLWAKSGQFSAKLCPVCRCM